MIFISNYAIFDVILEILIKTHQDSIFFQISFVFNYLLLIRHLNPAYIQLSRVLHTNEGRINKKGG